MSKGINELVGGAVADIAACVEIGFAASLGAAASATFGRLMKKRADAAREILLEELSQGDVHPTDVLGEDDIVAVSYRYARASLEGTARLNLRLIAKVLSGNLQLKDFVADKFPYYASVLSSLSRDEIVILASFYEEEESQEYLQIDENARAGFVYRKTLEKLVPLGIQDPTSFDAIATALTRTDFVTTVSAWEATLYETSPLLRDVLLLEASSAASPIEK